mgnify:CR=1 FL=1
MQEEVEREWAFSVLASLALVGALTEEVIIIIVPLALVIILMNYATERGSFFESIEGTNEANRIVEFSMGMILLTLLVTFFEMPINIFVISSMLVGYTYIIEKVMLVRDISPMQEVMGFVTGAWFLGVFSQILVMWNRTQIGTSRIVFFAIMGGLILALFREYSVGKNKMVSILIVAFILWILSIPPPVYLSIIPQKLMIGIGIAGGLGYISWKVKSASITGMLMGIIFSIVIIIYGGFDWFAVILSFFIGGSIVSRWKYEEKLKKGIAESNRGAREAKNVFANAVVAVICVICFSIDIKIGWLSQEVFMFAFTGAIAAAMSDTISSEIGIVYGKARMITTFIEVEGGTDGGVTLQGTLAGVGGAILIGILASLLLQMDMSGVVVIGVAGIIGMVGDSIAGACFEGKWMSNESVNMMATIIGAISAVIGAVGAGILIL